MSEKRTVRFCVVDGDVYARVNDLSRVFTWWAEELDEEGDRAGATMLRGVRDAIEQQAQRA